MRSGTDWEKNIYLIIRKRERKHLIVIKQNPEANSHFDFVQRRENYKSDLWGRT